MPPANPSPTPQPNPAPAPAPAPPAPPATPPISMDPQPSFTLPGGGAPAPAPAPAPQAEEPPAWAKDFIQKNEERWTNLDALLTGEEAGGGAPGAPAAPIGSTGQPAPQTPASELAARNPQSWADVEAFVNEKIDAARTGAVEDIKTEAQTVAENEQRARDEVNKQLDAAVDDLQTKGYLPAIANPADSNDPGRVYRRELYGMAAKLGTTDLASVATTVLKPLHDRGQLYDPISDQYINYNAPAPGAATPIGSSTTSTGQGGGAPDYKTIHAARSFSELRARAGL